MRNAHLICFPFLRGNCSSFTDAQCLGTHCLIHFSNFVVVVCFYQEIIPVTPSWLEAGVLSQSLLEMHVDLGLFLSKFSWLYLRASEKYLTCVLHKYLYCNPNQNPRGIFVDIKRWAKISVKGEERERPQQFWRCRKSWRPHIIWP